VPDVVLDLDRLRDIRAQDPGAVAAAASDRRRRELVGSDGRVMLIAADHAARNALGVRRDPMAIADRGELLHRLVTALRRPGVDGVLGSPDVLEDLLLLGELEDRVAVASMNRGGLQGAVFELDDRFTACDAATIDRMGWDAGKMLTRIGLDDPNTAATLEASARAVSELAERHLPAMVEPFMSRWADGRLQNDLSTEAVVRSVGVASALGTTSAWTWLKLPVVAGMEQVMAATTLPTLLLGGDPDVDPDLTYAAWEQALTLPGVRGLVVGRALLYPPGSDVAAAVDRAVAMVRS
jgi:hypothetical protein